MTERYLENGLRALEAGSGKTTIVLISGWPQTAEAFLPLFPHLEPHYHLLAIDPPGLGRSKPPSDGTYGAVSISKVMLQAVNSAVSSPYHLVGHDIGAWIVYPWALQASERLLSVTLIDGSVTSLAAPLPYPLPYEVNLKLFQFSFNALPELPELLTNGREREMLNWLFNTKAVHSDRISQNARDFYVRCYSQEGAMSRGFEYYRAVAANKEPEKELASGRKLGLPVVAIGADHGIGSALGAVLQPGTEGKVHGFVIEDCGHYVMEEQPEKTSEILLKVFQEIGVWDD